MSAAWDRHISALNALMAQNGINPAAAPAPQPQAAPAPAMGMPTGNIFANPSTTDTSLWQYLNGLNAQQTGLGPTGENVSFMGPGYGADGLRMPEFGMAGYAGGPPGTGPNLSFDGLNIPGWAGGLLGAGLGTIVAGPFGGLLGGVAGRGIASLFGGGGGGDYGPGTATSAVGGSANSQAAGYGGGYGTGPDGWGGL